MKNTAIKIENQLSFEETLFPAVIFNTSNLTDMTACVKWVKENKTDIEKELDKTGAVLFRGFPTPTAQDFDTFVRAFDYPNFSYDDSLSNALRISVTDRVFTANEAPPHVNIYLHHELAQTPSYPGKLFFYCEIAPEKGGVTPLCRSDILLERISKEMPQLVADFEKKGVRYTNVMADEADTSSGQGRSWKSLLKAQDREQAEKRLRDIGYNWEWQDKGLRVTSCILPAIRTLKDGRRVFFNQLIAAFLGWKDSRNDPSKAVTFGDGQAIPADAMARVCQIAAESSFDTPWQQGDIALVDNYLVMHGRKAFEGKRRVLASLLV